MSYHRHVILAISAFAGLIAIIAILRQPSDGLPLAGGDRFAHAIYMGVWALLIGGAIFLQGDGIGHSFRQLAIWSTIFLVFVAGYSYRYEIQDFASGITGELIPGSPIATFSAEGRPQITLIRNGYGHFNAGGKVNNTSVFFLIDTGASSIVLSHEDATRAGIDTEKLHYNIPVSTANGITTSARQTIDRLSIGPISYEHLPVMITQKGRLKNSLLGMSFINRLQRFEIRGDRMTLTQ